MSGVDNSNAICLMPESDTSENDEVQSVYCLLADKDSEDENNGEWEDLEQQVVEFREYMTKLMR